jgi:hypothetical protein
LETGTTGGIFLIWRKLIKNSKRYDSKASLWEENCPNFLAGQALKEGLRQKNFPEKTFPCPLAQSAVVFPAPLGLVPAQTKKKEKIGTIYCPKGGLAVVILIMTKLKSRRQAPTLGYFNYGPEKLLPQGLPLGRKLSQFFFFFVWAGLF